MGRRVSRESAMKLLYQLEFQKEYVDEQINEVVEDNNLKGKDKEYFLDVIEGVHKNFQAINEAIEEYAKGWEIKRMSRVDLSILRLAIYELKFREDIPINVLINEAVELAKKYSGKEASAFINGILGKLGKSRLEAEKTKE